jgi:DNA segregation ATPase FtsK/SpoIIIE-like protein
MTAAPKARAVADVEPNELQAQALAIAMQSRKLSIAEVQRKLRISYAAAQVLCQSLVDEGRVNGLVLAPSLNRHASALAALQAKLDSQRDAMRVYEQQTLEMAQKDDETRAALQAEVERLREALEHLVERANTSDDCQYGTLSTKYVRDIANTALQGGKT